MASDSCVSGSEDARTPAHGQPVDGKKAGAAPPGGGAEPTQRRPVGAGAGPVADPRDGAESVGNAHAGKRSDPKAARRPNQPNSPKAEKPVEAAKLHAAAAVPDPQAAERSQPAGVESAEPTTLSGPTAQPVAGVPGGVEGGGGPESGAMVPPAPSEGASDAEEKATDGFMKTVLHNHFLLFNAVPSWLVSMVIHAILLIVLALLTLPERPAEERIVAVANPNETTEVEKLEVEELTEMNVDMVTGEAPSEVIDEHTTTAELDVPSLPDVSAAPEQVRLDNFGELAAPSDDLLDRMGGGTGLGLGESRGERARKAAVASMGGSEGSEAAVAAALKWLAAHQERDGGWDFDHTRGPCKGQCTHPGSIQPSRNGATAMALLPFLGAGQTHKEGAYKEVVERGLTFLIRNMKLANGMGDLSDTGGRLYSHGLASIALCEAYAMTQDPVLLQPSQLAVNFIVYAQDPVGGGWRYEPQQPGDTSVLGWQLMACKSARMAYLKVPNKTFVGASRFLDFVQDQGGAQYGYTIPSGAPSTSAVGLLCRMYLGWKHDAPALKAGVEYLHQIGPTENEYYNYYATQVMRHYGGEYWTAWNAKLRDQLVSSQDQKGHAKGSWFFPKATYSDRGGRLYCTSMATMMLEVYYRHMPIYGKQASEEDFPL